MEPFPRSPPRLSSKSIKQSEGPKSSDDFCTGQGVVLVRAPICSAEAHLDCPRNPYSRVEAPNRLTTYVPTKASYLVEHGTVPHSGGPKSSDELCTNLGVILGRAGNHSTGVCFDCWRNPFSTLEANKSSDE